MTDHSNVTDLFGRRDHDDSQHGEHFPSSLLLSLGFPITYKNAVAYIKGYAEALSAAHAASNVHLDGFPLDVDERYSRSLRAQRRLRWDSWEMTILAEAIGWVEDPKDPHSMPDIDNLTPEQDRAALRALVPIVEDLGGLPQKFVKKLMA